MLLVLFAIFVFGFCAWAITSNIREQATGAARMAAVAALVVGCAAGVHGSDLPQAADVAASAIAGGFVALAAYAKWRARQRLVS